MSLSGKKTNLNDNERTLGDKKVVISSPMHEKVHFSSERRYGNVFLHKIIPRGRRLVCESS